MFGQALAVVAEMLEMQVGGTRLRGGMVARGRRYAVHENNLRLDYITHTGVCHRTCH